MYPGAQGGRESIACGTHYFISTNLSKTRKWDKKWAKSGTFSKTLTKLSSLEAKIVHRIAGKVGKSEQKVNSRKFSNEKWDCPTLRGIIGDYAVCAHG